MDTSKLKTFASNARDIIKDGVRFELRKKGFDNEGHILFEPQKLTNGTLFDGQILEEHFYNQWNALKNRIACKGIDYVYEETAYTWFNRLIAIQILSKNHIINEPVLEYVDAEKRIPYIIDEARNGRWTNIDDNSRKRAQAIINDYDKTAELFSILISSYCRNTPIINKCFGGIAEYTEILLPSNILVEGNFISMLNDTPYITDDDYSKTELLGWLYQFYIAKKKKEVNDKTRWDADEVPAGTQIFTPNWIVKYMVENTLGRIYLDHDSTASFKDSMRYLIEPCEEKRPIYQFQNLEDLKCGDLSCGSGHILNEFFDLLLLCYQEEGYDTKTAIDKIFRFNIVGVDLDTRAQQLSTFALLLKACQKDVSFANAEVMPLVLDMPSVTFDGAMPTINEWFRKFDETINNELTEAFKLVQDAHELGSIMKFNLSDCCREAIKEIIGKVDGNVEIIKALQLMLVLTEKYSAICMNPPYMGTVHMDNCLKTYATDNYPSTKADLFTVFMDVALDRLLPNAKYGMINMQNWMFISTFDSMRNSIVKNSQIDSMIQLGAKLFDELGGEKVKSVTFVITNSMPICPGSYYRLVHGRNCREKESLFFKEENKYTNIFQSTFLNIPKARICFWFSEKSLSVFKLPTISSIAEPREGMTTAGNNYFLRYWHEVNLLKIGFGLTRSEAIASKKKWFPYAKGGESRLWYGNQDYVVNWENDGYEIQHNFDPDSGRLRSHNYNLDYIFKECLSASRMNNSQRYYPKGFLCDSTGTPTYCSDGIYNVLAVANCKVSKYILDIFNPSLVIQPGDLSSLPYTADIDTSIVQDCISISKEDWDSHETSWNFKTNPIVSLRNQFGTVSSENVSFKISALATDYKAHWEHLFKKLHANEEELNRQFISIYGLEDELTPDVPMSEVTILQQDEISIDGDQIIWHDVILIKQLISYAMGCWMGRYRLDRPGLNIAHPNPAEEDMKAYSIYGLTFDIDNDGIVPLLPSDSPFTDNAINRFEDFVHLVFGEESFKDNWNFITNCLGKTDEYFTKSTGFWKDHKTIYQKTPIYWLFSSKGGYFKCLAYMHRMTQFTVRDIRDKYLLKYIDFLRNMINPLKSDEATLGREDKKKLAYYEKALKDCEEYDLLLNNVAQKFIKFNLDDGVKVNYAKFGDVLAAI